MRLPQIRILSVRLPQIQGAPRRSRSYKTSDNSAKDTRKGNRIMSAIMVRKARYDFEALLTAQAMDGAGADIISIAYDGEHQLQGALIPTSKFVVFARVPDGVQIDYIDERIDAAIDGRYSAPDIRSEDD